MWTYNYRYPNELTHYGVKGMKWGGVRRYQNKDGSLTRAGKRKIQSGMKNDTPQGEKTKRINYKDRVKSTYLKKGYTETDAEALALRKKKLRTAALIAGGVTVAVGAAFIARYYHVENNDVLLKAGSKAFHIARKDAVDLEKGRHLYATINQFDRKAYQWRLNNPEKIQRVERIFELTKDVRIPSPKKGEKLYKEFLDDSKNKDMVKEAFKKIPFGDVNNIDYAKFVTFSPYFSEGESFGGIGKHTSYNKTGVDLWKRYQDFIVNKGYQGLLDENDRNPTHRFNVERPAILFDAASKLQETSRKNPKESSWTPLIPTVKRNRVS